MTDLSRHTCRICGASKLRPVQGFDSLQTVSSDCRPCEHSAVLTSCAGCGTVQKVADEAWRKTTREIYEAYEPYHQAGGSEQRVFDASGGSVARSEQFLTFVLEEAGLPEAGVLLDIGCGNGGLLASMHTLRPSWELHGHELGETQREVVCSLPGVCGFCSGPLDEIDQQFDLITMVHVLEHIEAPLEFLEQARALLKPDGLLAVQVPGYQDNPFDLLIFDHCTHFDLATLAHVAGRAGLAGDVKAGVVPKELSVVLRPGGDLQKVALSESGPARAQCAADWLLAVRDGAVAESVSEAAEGVGIFGTAIAASWLMGELAGKVDFLVDENPACVGRPYLGKPVLRPREVPAGSRVVVPLAPVVAELVVKRMQRKRPDVCWLPSPPMAT